MVGYPEITAIMDESREALADRFLAMPAAECAGMRAGF